MSARKRFPDLQERETERQSRVTERRFLLASLCLFSQVDLFRDRQSVVHFDAEIADGALKLRMTQKQLHRANVSRLLVYLRGFRPHRMSSVSLRIEPDAGNPFVDNPSVLPGRQMRFRPHATWEQIVSFGETATSYPGTDGSSGLLRDLKLHRPPGLVITARSRTMPDSATSPTLMVTKSQPLSLLSMARLKSAKSRSVPDTCSRVRMLQTSRRLRGGF